MIKSILLTTILFVGLTMAQDIEFANRLFYSYPSYRESSITTKRVKLSGIVPLIEQLKGNSDFTIKAAGKSAEGRDIYLIKLGTGKTKIFMWSQMHGDESTATMAFFDIFNFFKSNDVFNDIREKILNNVTVYFMPMVNPDGAAVFQRRNSFDIDINRDAIAQQTPEGKILKETFDSIKADFGFNLHDQSIFNSAGHNFEPATLSFLAPATNYEKTVNEVRSKAIKLTGLLSSVMSNFIPGHIAKYPDDFEPRAFGDNFQKWGTSTILIESGGWKEDPEKQFARKLNFVALLSAINSIAEKSYIKEPLETYDKIPFNERDMMNLIIRNVKYHNHGFDYSIDIGITRTEENDESGSSYFYRSTIEDIGDLSTYFGYEDLDMKGMEIFPGKTYPQKFSSYKEIEGLDFNKLYQHGYTNVILNSNLPKEKFSSLPVNIIANNNSLKEDIKIGLFPNFIIKKNNQVKYVVVNGFLLNITNNTGEIKNGLILD